MNTHPSPFKTDGLGELYHHGDLASVHISSTSGLVLINTVVRVF